MNPEDTTFGDPSSRVQGPHVLLAVGFEGSLAVLAVGISWLCGHWPLVGMFRSGSVKGELIAAVIGLVATFPLLIGLWLVGSSTWEPLGRLRKLVRDLLSQLLGGASVCQLAMVALSAGIGEELLFRGLIQAGLASWLGRPWGAGVGLAVASVLFGVCHWLSPTYALLAAGAGLYFGVLMMVTGSLWTPLVAHAVYDFIALVYLLAPGRNWQRVG